MIREYVVEYGEMRIGSRKIIKEWTFNHALAAYHHYLDIELKEDTEYVKMYESITTEDTGDTVYRILEQRGRKK